MVIGLRVPPKVPRTKIPAHIRVQGLGFRASGLGLRVQGLTIQCWYIIFSVLGCMVKE